jgi:hypothetical protein
MNNFFDTEHKKGNPDKLSGLLTVYARMQRGLPVVLETLLPMVCLLLRGITAIRTVSKIFLNRSSAAVLMMRRE